MHIFYIYIIHLLFETYRRKLYSILSGCVNPTVAAGGSPWPTSSTVTTPTTLPGSTAPGNILPANCWGLGFKLKCTGLPSQVFLGMIEPSLGYLSEEVDEAGEECG